MTNHYQSHLTQFLEQVRGKLIVSCQALPDEPLHGAEIMARMAVAVWQGGAVGIRANGPDDIRAIKQAAPLPVIGLYKDGDKDVYITPTFEHAVEVAEAGADVIAIDATQRERPDGRDLDVVINLIQRELDKPVLADISTFAEGVAAVEAGADLVSTTLSGYTPYSRGLAGPDLELVRELVARLAVPVFAEGRIRTPQEARAALDCGAFAVIVGGAITRPQWITAQFVAGLQGRSAR